MFTLGLGIAAIFAVVYFVIGAVFDTHQDNGIGGVVTVAIIGFVIMTIANWLYLRGAPPLYFGIWWQIITINTVVFMVLAGIKNGIVHYNDSGITINGSTNAFVGLFVFLLLTVFFMGIGRPWGSQAYRLAHLPSTHSEAVGAYPPTDTEHISLVPEQAAQFKADQALTQAQGKFANLSTQYDVGDGAEQSINNHLYWVFALHLNGWRVANRVGRIVPGYIVVDAENPEAQPLLKLGYNMKYTPGAPTGNSLKRLVWVHYKHYAVDDLTLEVNDDWQPYYTATINKPAYSYGPTIPVRSIVVDPQTGKITDYDINKTPAWVDRVYSADTVKRMMNWWGSYGAGPTKTPRKFLGIGETSSNRYKVSGDPTLVYTKDGDTGHPEWQVLMTSQRSDTSATFVALFDGRSTDVRLYRVSNLQTDTAVLSAFESTAANVKKFTPTNLALHKIYGHLTWVAEYVPNSDANGPLSLQALGLLAADNAGGINVQMASTKGDVLTAYRLWLANSSNNDTPNPDSKTKSINGTVTRVSSVVISGNTTIYLILDSDPKHVYRGSVNDKLPELPFAAPGAKVTITYTDVGNATVDITAYDDAGLTLSNSQ